MQSRVAMQSALVPMTVRSKLANAWLVRLALLALVLAAGNVHAFIIAPIIKQPPAPVGRLNDTGALLCYDGSLLAACNIANSGSGAPYPHQDATIGRDAAAAVSVGLTKSGGGSAGFDFTRVCFNGSHEGSALCTGTLVANTTGAANTIPTCRYSEPSYSPRIDGYFV